MLNKEMERDLGFENLPLYIGKYSDFLIIIIGINLSGKDFI
jgi:hypothetical protein